MPCSTRPSNTPRWLLAWLLFRLLFSSGFVKLASGDPSWRDWTALTYHYQTQPLPPWTAWFAHQLPAWFHEGSVFLLLMGELVVPFLLFAGRRPRRLALAALLLLQILFMVTGNFAFFNLLTIALLVLFVEDSAWPARLHPMPSPAPVARGELRGGRRAGGREWPTWVTVPVALLVFLLSVGVLAETMGLRVAAAPILREPRRVLSPLRLSSHYGLFAVMTKVRNEIVVEGSDDGERWLPYEFRWKPGEVTRRPGFVAPHQPRLDWQMWFAALGSYEENVWFLAFLERLLEGSPEVLALLERNPFPDRPPRYVRAVFYEYRFTNADERRASRAWWRLEERGLYCPPLSLREPATEVGSEPPVTPR